MDIGECCKTEDLFQTHCVVFLTTFNIITVSGLIEGGQKSGSEKNLPDISVLMEFADFYSVDIREILAPHCFGFFSEH